MGVQLNESLKRSAGERIYACSFTRAAATELAGRNNMIPESNIGTIHSLCYRRYEGKKTIIEVDKELLDEWNKRYGHTWPVMYRSSTPEEEEEQWSGDRTGLTTWNVERARMSGRKNPLDFVKAWEEFKEKNNAIDFTDMLLNAPDDLECDVLLVDEAQDLTPLQFKIVRQWGGKARDMFCLAGDDDQCIYEWMGASPADMLSELPPERKRYLKRSFRLPRKIHAYADKWIKKLGPRREPKDFEPRDEEGDVESRAYSLQEPENLINEVKQVTAAGKTVMVLASCAYMLAPMIEAMRKQGLAFHNPYRRIRTDWNPLQAGKTGRKILAFDELQKTYHSDDVAGAAKAIESTELWQKWVGMVQAKDIFVRGGKKFLTEWGPDTIPYHKVVKCFEQYAIQEMFREGLPWLEKNLTGTTAKKTAYPFKILKEHGIDALRAVPKIIVGTIHSVKGGEADVVILAPDLSFAAARQIDESPRAGKDGLIRQFYVGMTRARETLVRIQPSSKHFVDL